jgi:hypothetical protein
MDSGPWPVRQQPCSSDAAGDLTIDDAEGGAERGRGLGLVARHERAQDAVMHLWCRRS